MGHIHNLPTEILDLILNLLHGDALFNLAISSKPMLDSIRSRLLQHKEMHEKFHFVHDRHPLTILSVLRLAFARPDIAWHIRKIEVWEARTDWSCWTMGDYSHDWRSTFPLKRFAEEDLDFDTQWELEHAFVEAWADFKHLTEAIFQPAELSQYQNSLETLLLLSPEEVEAAMNKLRKGDDEVLKALLICLCPRLQTLVYVQNSRFWGQGGAEHALYILMSAVKAVVKKKDAGQIDSWPPGLQSLQTLAISECVPQRHPHDNFYVNFKEASTFLLLPKLATFKLSVSNINREDPRGWDFGERTSNVQEVELHCCGDPDLLLGPCPNVKSLKIAGGSQLGPSDFLLKWKDTLENLDCTEDRLHDVSQVQSVLPQFTRLRNLKVPLNAFMEEDESGELITDKEKGSRPPLRLLNLCELLPPCLENLTIARASSTLDRRKNRRPDKIHQLFQELGRLVLAKKNTHQALKSIRAVIFDVWADGELEDTGERNSEDVRRLQELCTQAGITLFLFKEEEYKAAFDVESGISADPRYVEAIPASESPVGPEYTLERVNELLKESSAEEVGRQLAAKYKVKYEDYEWNGPNRRPKNAIDEKPEKESNDEHIDKKARR